MSTYWWSMLLAACGALVLLWLILVVGLWRAQRREPEHAEWREVLRLLPDVVRLLRRLIADRELPPRLRFGLGLLLGYLLSPVDIVPDFVPGLGYADDAIIVALALRTIVRRAGSEALARNWPGTPQGLTAVRRVAGLPR